MKIKSLNFKGIPAYTYPLDMPATLKRFQLLFIWVILDQKDTVYVLRPRIL